MAEWFRKSERWERTNVASDKDAIVCDLVADMILFVAVSVSPPVTLTNNAFINRGHANLELVVSFDPSFF